MTAVEDFLQATMPRLIDAELSLHRGNVAGRLAMWSAHDPVTLFGAAAPSKSGWDQVEPVFGSLAALFAACNTYDLELVAAGASGDLAYTVAHEHYEALTNDGSLLRNTLPRHPRLPPRGRRVEDRPPPRRPSPVDQTPQPESPDVARNERRNAGP